MKKNSFVQGALIATAGIVITKILGVIFVIPFFAIIGDKGGALYSYTYVIYSIFLSLSSVGIPLAISKLTSEYDALGDYHLKERAFKLAKRLLLILSMISFIILIAFAPQIAELFIGDIKGGNTVSDIAFTIRMVATGLLVVPALSVTRGYLQGHKYITPSSISQVVEQIVRIVILLLGSYLCLEVFHLPMRVAVGIAVFAATIGAIAAYLYLLKKMNKNRDMLRQSSEIKREEVRITSKDIVKKLISYAVPFIMSGLIISVYNFIDLATIVKTMVNNLHYSVEEAETVASMLANWTSKIEMIIVSVGMGLTTSLLPTITDSFARNNMEDVKNKINKSLQLLLYVITPMTIGLSLLAAPVWTFFFGYSSLGNFIFAYNVYTTLFSTLMMTLCIILQSINEHKKMMTYLTIGIIAKLLLNIPLMYSFHSYGFHASYGPSTATIIGFLISCVLILVLLSKKLKISYEHTFKRFIDIIFATIIMAIIILLVQMVIPINTHSHLTAFLITILYAIIGGTIYFFVTIKNGLFHEVFGAHIMNKIMTKLKLKKREEQPTNEE